MVSITIHDDEIHGALKDMTVTIKDGKTFNQMSKRIWAEMMDLLLSWRKVRKGETNKYR